jgi:putative oxidoreductase
MTQNQLSQTAIFLLRISLGVMFLAHSVVLKLMVFTLAGNAQFFESIGYPGWVGYAVFGAETVGGLMLVLGIQARWAALALTPILIGATWQHFGNGWMFGYQNGGWEYPAYLSVLSIAQFMLGDGRFALVRSSALPSSEAGTAVPKTA